MKERIGVADEEFFKKGDSEIDESFRNNCFYRFFRSVVFLFVHINHQKFVLKRNKKMKIFVVGMTLLFAVTVVMSAYVVMVKATDCEIINQWREPHPDYDRFGGVLFATVNWGDGHEEILWYSEGMLHRWWDERGFTEADSLYHKLDESERDYLPESEWKYTNDLYKWVW